jgi:sec-independent protein translocase protein TatA
MGNLGGWEIVAILAVFVLLFGAKKLPDMARSIGQSARVFKGEMKGLKDDEARTPPPAAKPAEPTPLPPAPPAASADAPQASEPVRRDADR